MPQSEKDLINEMEKELIHIISETNGISLTNTLELLAFSPLSRKNPQVLKNVDEFIHLLAEFHIGEIKIERLLTHPLSLAFKQFFKSFPLPYHEEHIHLTGSLSAEFIYPRLKVLIEGPHSEIYKKKITEVYGEDSWPITSVQDVDRLIRLKEGEQFKTYLKILFLPKLILIDKQAHVDAAYHMASELYNKYNVGKIRLKFTLSRSSGISSEQIPGTSEVSEEDVCMGLFEGFQKFKDELPSYDFVLSPSFRKEADFFDTENYKTKKEHFNQQVNSIIDLREKYPELENHLTEVDTVGDEKELYRKAHFEEMRTGLRRLQYGGFRIRSHHGETWKVLRKGVQSVDNAMNIWHIDTLEHGLSLGVNPNYYFHRIYQKAMDLNRVGKSPEENTQLFDELSDMEWHDESVRKKIFSGKALTEKEETSFIKTKFHTAREIEHYQHDVLNRMIHKKVSLVALPSSNLKLTGMFPDYKDHPFSWWEKKGVQLGIGTDNYITLSTDYINELLIVLYSDPESLKITKLIMVATREKRRPYISHLLWNMRKEIVNK